MARPRGRAVVKMLFLLVGLTAGGVAVAQVPTLPAETARRAPSGNPNEVVCINQPEIGSRLTRRRVCRTRAQWEETQMQTRTVLERVQLQKQTGNQ